MNGGAGNDIMTYDSDVRRSPGADVDTLVLNNAR
jgi:hypothetical protein